MFSSLLNKTKSTLFSSRTFNDEHIKHSSTFNIPEGFSGHLVVIDERGKSERAMGLKDDVYDCIRSIRDPEKAATLEDLNVVCEDGVQVEPATTNTVNVIRVEFNPTVPHCSLATLIGLCMRVKLERHLAERVKLDIYIKKGTHSTEDEINKQVNDKERVAAAMENPSLREKVEDCIRDQD